MDIRLHKRALHLSYFTVAYNIIEGLICIIGGFIIGSISLVAFGLDSFVESLSSGILIWRFTKHDDSSDIAEDEREKKATKLIAYTFFILGMYVLFEAGKKLLNHESPDQSLIGIVIALLSIAIMSFVWRAKYKLGKEMNSSSLVADSKQTLACIFMSVILLVSLGLNYLYGLWWTDAVGGIIIAGFLFKEGYESLQGEDND